MSDRRARSMHQHNSVFSGDLSSAGRSHATPVCRTRHPSQDGIVPCVLQSVDVLAHRLLGLPGAALLAAAIDPVVASAATVSATAVPTAVTTVPAPGLLRGCLPRQELSQWQLVGFLGSILLRAGQSRGDYLGVCLQIRGLVLRGAAGSRRIRSQLRRSHVLGHFDAVLGTTKANRASGPRAVARGRAAHTAAAASAQTIATAAAMELAVASA